MKQKTTEAKKTLETWKESYFDVRAKIEASGRDARWEFDRKRLFERTDHMASICDDLKEVATVMEEFYNIFGPELKAVTGDPKRIEDVLKRVDGLVKPIENVSIGSDYEVKYQAVINVAKNIQFWNLHHHSPGFQKSIYTGGDS